jgi:hypothetical protein
MPKWATAVALDRRGKAHIYDNLDPQRVFADASYETHGQSLLLS